jgi:hypothetical protein
MRDTGVQLGDAVPDQAVRSGELAQTSSNSFRKAVTAARFRLPGNDAQRVRIEREKLICSGVKDVMNVGKRRGMRHGAEPTAVIDEWRANVE